MMVWDSIALMTVIDLVIIGVAVVSVFLFARRLVRYGELHYLSWEVTVVPCVSWARNL